jgi:hypothetical protein
MYCPQCGAEYRDGFTKCSDCHLALVPVLATETPDPQLELVTVFESNDDFAIALAKGSLEDSGIPFWIHSDEAHGRLLLGPIMFPSCRFLVPKDREAEARELLQLLESPIEDKDRE